MLTKSPGSVFWTLVGIGVLALLLAAGWRVAMGAELEAKGKEWSLKVTEAADTLDDARKQLEVEAQRIRTEAKKREEDLATQLAAARAACPKIAEKLPAPPVPPVATAIAPSQAALAKVARTAEGARDAARDIARIKVPRL